MATLSVAVGAGESEVCDGRDLAALLAAHTPSGTDLRFWLCWPEHSEVWARLRRNLWELAESTGSVVWTPPAGGQVDVVPGCRDLGCTVDGEPAVWEAYHPRAQRRLRFNSDADGRLVPAGRLSFDSLPLDDGALMLHMPVLEDGRLAAVCTDGSRHPLGPRQLYNLLHECAWAGEPIVLAEEVGSVQAMLVARYLDDVGRALGRQLPIHVRPVRAYAPEVRARHVTSRRPPMLPSGTSLADQVIDLLMELPSLQRQCRTLVRDDPAGSTDLLTEWYDLHRELVEARHAPAIRAIWASQSTMDVSLTETDRRDAVERADALGRARQRFVQHLKAVRLAGIQLALPGTSSVIDVRWDGHLRMVTNIALARIDPSDPDQARQMRGLAQAISGLATASEPELDDPDPLGHPAVQLRMHIERVAAGADVGAERRIPSRALTTDDEAELDPYEARYGPDPTQTVNWKRPAAFLARPRLVQAGRRNRQHGLSWLPQTVHVNDHEFEVYVESARPTAHAAASGLPSARMFLVGHLEPSPGPDRYEVRIRVARHAAVDVPASGDAPPASLRAEVCANDAYVLPAAWLDRCQILLDDKSGAGVPAAMWCSGARHGIDGLPDTDHAWPRALRGSIRAYARVPERDNAVGWLSLYRGLPRASDGLLVELTIGNGRAIDLVRLSAQLAALPAVRTIVPDLRAQGVRLVLPNGEFERAPATRVFEAEGGRWRPRRIRRGFTLAGLIAKGE